MRAATKPRFKTITDKALPQRTCGRESIKNADSGNPRLGMNKKIGRRGEDLQDDKIAIVVGTVTNDVKVDEIPCMKVTALKFTKTIARIQNAGECLAFDQLALRAPFGQNAFNWIGGTGESRVEPIKEEEEKAAEVVATTETKFPMYGEERHQSRDWEVINEMSVGLSEAENLEVLKEAALFQASERCKLMLTVVMLGNVVVDIAPEDGHAPMESTGTKLCHTIN
ncbi:60S ribosomal protein L18-2 [Tanacetum coccineum]|uniref:60S ribosomal protein L18-2 n=1 Tax=Tanacetum coccineum TaxID=301880 RepID=A0ABQ5HPR2_9ASTR